MANKTFNTRVKNKRDTAANWEAVATTFQPLDGELIIVDTAAGKLASKLVDMIRLREDFCIIMKFLLRMNICIMI